VVGTWLVVVLLALGTAAGAVLGLSATTFGASSFVRVYLEAVGRGDAAGALAIPGVTVSDDVRTDFLVGDALDGLVGLREVSVEPGDEGATLVTYAWSSPRGDGVSTFTVERDGATLGVFPRWRFAVSPVATLRLTVEHDDRFRVAGVPARTGVGAEPVGYAVLVPGVYRIDHRSHYLRADELDLAAERPGSELGATLDVQPALVFTIAVTAEVNASLDACATQEVLFPTGCPFGQAIANRVVSPPDWSIAAYPDIHLEPGDEFGTWQVPAAELTAHLRVDVQSLFDGSVSTFDRDLPATAGYLVTILADDATLRIELAG
jgi:hypothetical protein